MTEPDDKQSTGISPDTPREEAVSHVTEDIPFSQSRSFLSQMALKNTKTTAHIRS